MKRILLISAAAMLASAATAYAASPVVATTDLNVRSGPGPQHPVVGVIGAGASASLDGCIQGSKWCSVNGGEGWVYSDYLTGDFGGSNVVVTQAQSGVEYIPAPDGGGGAEGAATGIAAGAITGAIVGGPIGAAIGGVAGGVAGGAAGQAIDPPNEVRTYVTTNKVEPVYLDGEVVVGATLPENVEFREIPDYQYRYVYVNGQPVLVEPGSRQVVYILR